MRHSIIAFAGITLLTTLPSAAAHAVVLGIKEVTVECNYWKGGLTSLKLRVERWPSPLPGGTLLYYYVKKGFALVPGPNPVGGGLTNPVEMTLPASYALSGPLDSLARTVQIRNAALESLPYTIYSLTLDIKPLVAQCPLRQLLSHGTANRAILQGLGQLRGDAANWTWKMNTPRAQSTGVR
jgi:hypothetical protein